MNEEAIQQINEKIVRMEEQLKTAFRRIDENRQLAETVHSLALSIERLTNALNTTNARVNELSTDVEEMKSRPAKRWESIVAAIISAVIGVLVGMFLRP